MLCCYGCSNERPAVLLRKKRERERHEDTDGEWKSPFFCNVIQIYLSLSTIASTNWTKLYRTELSALHNFFLPATFYFKCIPYTAFRCYCLNFFLRFSFARIGMVVSNPDLMSCLIWMDSTFITCAHSIHLRVSSALRRSFFKRTTTTFILQLIL